jgi:competence protein ComEA
MKKATNIVIAFVVLSAIGVMSTGALAADTEGSTAASAVVNINSATAAELSLLPGVGPSKAEAIVKYRAANPFKQVDQIMRVKGIGKKSFQSMKPYLTVEGPTTLKAKVKLSK